MADTTFEVIELSLAANVNSESVNPLAQFEWINYTDISSVAPHVAELPTRMNSGKAPGRARRKLQAGDIVISTVRPNRRSFFRFNGEWENAICSTGFAVVSPKNETESEYLYAYLTSREATRFYESICEGGAYPAFNASLLNGMEIPWPPKTLRATIGELSGQIRTLVHLNKTLSGTLEQIAQSLFKSWFIDFDPVHAKARGVEPDGMSPESAALFPDSFEDSVLGPIPLGWEVREARDLFDFSIGRTPPRKENEWFCDGGEGIPWVSIRDMGSYGAFTGATAEGLTDEAIGKFRVPVVPPGSVLVSFKLTLGRVAIARRPLATNEAIAHFIPRDTDSIPTEFAYLWLKNLDYTSLDSTSSIATATNSSLMKQILFLKPSDEVMRVFIERCAMLFLEIENLTLQNETLSEIRDSLLPRLISGELEVPDELMGG
jgi:type I restriction enzyme S subunit